MNKITSQTSINLQHSRRRRQTKIVGQVNSSSQQTAKQKTTTTAAAYAAEGDVSSRFLVVSHNMANYNSFDVSWTPYIRINHFERR